MNLKLVVPDYYKEFKCIADNCKHNCCEGGWLIELGDDTVKTYQNTKGKFGDELRSSIEKDDEGSWCFVLKDGKCPFLNKSGLCRIYGELGEESMGVVCREFPRFTLYYGNVKEMGIGLACEEAAGIILSNEGMFKTIESILDEDITETENDEACREYISVLISARKKIFEILGRKEKTFESRLHEILFFTEGFQEAVNTEDTEVMRSFIENGEYCILKCSDDRNEPLNELVYIYESLEQLNNEWQRKVPDLKKALAEKDYADVYKRAENGLNAQYNLMVYFIYRYFMKAVYDYNVLDKVKLSICNYIILTAMFAAAEKKAGGMLYIDEMTEEARIFSRQVEYSDDNIEAICEEFNFGDAFSTESLILLL